MKRNKKLSLMIKVSAAVSLFVFLFNKVAFAVSTVKERLYYSNTNYFSWKFGKISYTVKGSGNPVLLVHDLNCTSSSYEWNKIVDSLSISHTVYAIDLLGCGHSDKPMITYTNYLYVQLINDFIKSVIKHKTDIIATKNSSTFTIMSCYIEPQLFNNIILVNPEEINKPTVLNTKVKNLKKYILELPLLGTLIYNIVTSKYHIRRKFRSEIFFKPYGVTSRLVEGYCEAAHLGGPSARYLLSSIHSNYLNISVTHALKEINNNIYIILGDEINDKECIVESYSQINSSIEFDFISDTKYLPQLECPGTFVNACEIYL